VGDEVSLPEEAGSSPREIVVGQSNQRTLFQDIFGRSAFIDFSNNVSSSTSQVSEAHSRPWTGKEVSKIFDRPAYLLPSLESLYGPLMESFLKPRMAEDIDVSNEAERGYDEDMDVDDTPVQAAIVKARPRQVVNQDEKAIFVDLFKKHLKRTPRIVYFSHLLTD